jgi:multimeric flavodoxin WrbA
MNNILIINGSISGKSGNSFQLLKNAQNILITKYQINVEIVHLVEQISKNLLEEKMNCANGFIFSSGTYWDSWGSPMQKFLEETTDLEATSTLFAKPASVIITMHSVGGKEVMSRLQGVLSSQGYLIPPMSSMAISLTAKLALENGSSFAEDFWSEEDLPFVLHNLMAAIDKKYQYAPWPVDKKDPSRVWI